MIGQVESMLAEVTSMDACSIQPNSGANGEYAGLLAIRRYLDSQERKNFEKENGKNVKEKNKNNEKENINHRDICIIPMNAHGTNAASAVMANFKVSQLRQTINGEMDLEHLSEILEKKKKKKKSTLR
eukprot:Trichotokara_eunicae@DN5441_c0_g1_i5.p1